MKKIIAAIIIIASAAVFGQTVTFVHDLSKIKPKTQECLIFDIDVTMLKGTRYVDELGSQHYHLDWVTKHMTKVVYYQKTGNFWKSYEARVSSNGKSINGSGTTHCAVVVMNTYEGETNGYISFTFVAGKLDDSTPGVNCHLSGRTTNVWDEELQRYVLKSGSGIVSGASYPTNWAAWGDLKPAIPAGLSSIAPVWGSFTVRRGVLTDAEIIAILKAQN